MTIKVAIYYTDNGLISRRLDIAYCDVSLSLLQGEEFFINCPIWATHIINDEPITITHQSAMSELLMAIRDGRNRLLQSCDWTQTLDAPLSPEKKVEWAAYRQVLRDFPSTCDPENPIWPIPPI